VRRRRPCLLLYLFSVTPHPPSRQACRFLTCPHTSAHGRRPHRLPAPTPRHIRVGAYRQRRTHTRTPNTHVHVPVHLRVTRCSIGVRGVTNDKSTRCKHEVQGRGCGCVGSINRSRHTVHASVWSFTRLRAAADAPRSPPRLGVELHAPACSGRRPTFELWLSWIGGVWPRALAPFACETAPPAAPFDSFAALRLGSAPLAPPSLLGR